MWRSTNVLFAMMLAGCANMRDLLPSGFRGGADAAPPLPVMYKLDEQASRISHDLDQLMRISEQGAPEAHAYRIPTSGVLAMPVTLNWS